MESKRQQKFGRLIQKDLSDIFLKNLKELTSNGLATITNVKMSPDLSVARVYISLIGINNEDEFFERLDEKKSDVRRILGNKIGKQVRKVPELAFFHDTVDREANAIDQIIEGLNIPPAEDENE